MSKVSSQFAFLPILVALVVSVMSPFVIYMSAISPAAGLVIPIFSLIIPLYFWLTEFRTRAHRVIIGEKRISKREYFGLGVTKSFPFDNFDGFITSRQPGRLGPKEFIFLMKNGKRIICISEYYHRNYPRLKEAVENKLPYLGEKEYRFGYEYKQMFR